MSFTDYAAIEAVNWSTLRHMASSPLHYLHTYGHPVEETPAMLRGRTAHCAVLEPDAFPLEFVVFDGARRAGKEWEQFADANAARTIIKRDDYERALAIRDAVHAHPVAGELLRGEGHSEVSLTWTDAPTGLPCKGRLDRISGRTLIEFKTTASIDERVLRNQIAKMLWHCQLAFYHSGLEAAYGGKFAVVLIAAEQEPPHDVGVFDVGDEELYAGGEQVRELLDLLVECRASDSWPGRYPTRQKLELPAWVYQNDESEYELTGLVPSKGRAA
jgi:exodeoxyribonuclease VIII